MKKIFFIFYLTIVSFEISFAQLPSGSTAPNFIITDTEGVEHNLYEILDSGKSVLLDLFAVWCGPCWTFAQTGVFEDFNETYGNSIFAISVETDPSTPVEYLDGGGNSIGDWTELIGYSLANDDLIGGDYQLQYYPTIYLISPDRTVNEIGLTSPQGEYWNVTSLAQEVFQYTGESIDGVNGNSILNDPIWSDDFSDPTLWTVAHDETACSLDWEIGTGLSCGGSFPIATIASTTYDNGVAMIDSDEYGGEEGGTDVEDSWMTMAEPVDLTGYENVILQFESWYRSYNSEKCFIVTSTNGTDWPELTPGFDASTNPNVYEAFPGISGTSGEELPTNPTLWRTNISASAGNQGQIWVRFHWTGTWGYAWFIDDVAILEQPQNDIVLNSGYSSNSTGIEYGRTPSKQLPDTLYMGGVVNNFGINDQDNVTTDISISDASGNPIVSTSATQLMLENDSTTVLEAIVTNFSFEEGVYDLSVEASSDLDNSSGEEYSNNSYTRKFEITNNLYSMDGIGVYENPSLSSLGSNSFTDDPNGMVLMAMYTIEETTEISGLEIGITTSSMEDGLVFPFIIGEDAWLADDPYDRIVENYDGVMVTQYNIDNNLLWAPLEPTTLEPGIYFACVELYSDDINHVRVLDDETVAQPNGASTIFLPSDVDQTIYTNGTAFAIRMGSDGYVDLDEETVSASFSISPNPSNGIFTVSLDEANNYIIEVTNLLGEVISSKNVNGMMNETFDLSSFSAGVYVVKVSNNSLEQIQRIIIE